MLVHLDVVLGLTFDTNFIVSKNQETSNFISSTIKLDSIQVTFTIFLCLQTAEWSKCKSKKLEFVIFFFIIDAHII